MTLTEYTPILLAMSTTVHLPADLLASVDDQARELGMSRNRYIIRALKRILETETCWSARFVEELAEARSDDEARAALTDLVAGVAANRTRKAPPVL